MVPKDPKSLLLGTDGREPSSVRWLGSSSLLRKADLFSSFAHGASPAHLLHMPGLAWPVKWGK